MRARLFGSPRSRLLASVVVALVATGATAGWSIGAWRSGAGPGHTWYVSRNGDDSAGTSWATAWNELDRIGWAQVRPGDQIVVDGGATRCASNHLPAAATPDGLGCGMLYRTALTVGASGTASRPITIRVAGTTGHDGTAVVFGGRATPLPYCGQRSYAPVGRARAAGVALPGRQHVVIDGGHRGGLMIYGARSGVDLMSDSTAFVTLRNLEIFDNGTYQTWPYGYRTDGEGISLAGHDIAIDRDLIHDNGQDAIQDRDTGVPGTRHAPLRGISVTDSWLYEHRANPLYRGFGFNSGAQDVTRQDCTHVDGVQVWGGGLHQGPMTFTGDVFGPFLAQGVYLGETNAAGVDNVTISDSLFLNDLDHSIIADPVARDPSSPHAWRIANVTSYMTDRPNTGLATHGKVDLPGTGSTLINSIFYNGYFAQWSAFTTASGNIWWGGDPVPGGRQVPPAFRRPPAAIPWPSYDALASADLTPTCAGCRGAGARLHSVGDLLARIDSLNGGH